MTTNQYRAKAKASSTSFCTVKQTHTQVIVYGNISNELIAMSCPFSSTIDLAEIDVSHRSNQAMFKSWLDLTWPDLTEYLRLQVRVTLLTWLSSLPSSTVTASSHRITGGPPTVTGLVTVLPVLSRAAGCHKDISITQIKSHCGLLTQSKWKKKTRKIQ